MKTFEVRRPERPNPSRRAAAAAVFVVLALLAVSYRPFLTCQVVLDGEHVAVGHPAVVADLAAEAGAAGLAGDLIAADDGSVALRGGGSPAVITRAGRPLVADARVWPVEKLASHPGADLVEAVVTRDMTVAPEIVEVGQGPMALVVREGVPGRALVTVGSATGREVSRTVLTRAVDTRVVRSGGQARLHVVSLTFDDGPWPGQTERILEILAEERVRATFFMLGANAARYPELVRRVVAEGHEVGNHTWSHTTDGSTPAAVAGREIDSTQRAVWQASGVVPRWFRPPGGRVGPGLVEAARTRGLRIVWWTVDPWDWSRPGEAVLAERVVGATRPGSIVLLHDGGGDRSQTIVALRDVIRRLKQGGYTMVTLDELAEIQSAQAER